MTPEIKAQLVDDTSEEINSLISCNVKDGEEYIKLLYIATERIVSNCIEKLQPEWVSDGMPEYGKPVLIKSNGAIQNITYFLDGSDVDDYTTNYWFEPYLNENIEMCIDVEDVEAWIYVESLSQPQQSEE